MTLSLLAFGVVIALNNGNLITGQQQSVVCVSYLKV